MAPSTRKVPRALSAALAEVATPTAAVQLSTGRYLIANRPYQDLFDERSMEQIVPPDDRHVAMKALHAVSAGQIDGYNRHGRFVTADGREISAQICVRSLETLDIPDTAFVAILPADQADFAPSFWRNSIGAVVDLAIVVTDHDWHIEHVSHEVQLLLGYDPESLIGTALLGLVHPDDALKFLQATTVATTSRHAVVSSVRLRAADGSWRELNSSVSTLCGHKPPRLAVLLSPPGPGPTTTGSDREEQLEQHLWRIAMEVRSAGLVRDLDSVLPPDRAREFNELSGRQWEIVTRLANGERVPEIARSMYLSQSTVRNHLTAAYRKFGVHSQQELLALLRGAARPSA